MRKITNTTLKSIELEIVNILLSQKKSFFHCFSILHYLFNCKRDGCQSTDNKQAKLLA